MARMIPDAVSETSPATAGSGERAVFAALKDGLDDSFTVLHRVAWIEKKSNGGAVAGEADFVLLHPRLGMLCLEVKGGGIERDPLSGSWNSTDRNGTRHPIKDPFLQAEGSRHSLFRKAQALRGWRPGYMTLGHGVCFPDVATAADWGPNAPSEIVLTLSDLNRIERRIAAIFEYWRNTERDQDMGSDRLNAILAMLAPAKSVPYALASDIRSADLRILQLTAEQASVLSLLSKVTRARISGGAGTGKTMLALEKARQLGTQGFRTLYTCFNRGLADEVSRLLGEAPNVTVLNFHRLCLYAAQRASLPVPKDPIARGSEYFDRELPDLLAAALNNLDGGLFDAIVVDEGQDFDDSWWDLLEMASSAPSDCVLYVFYDGNQSVHRRGRGFQGGLPEFPLTRNLRNTRAIHEAAARFYAGPALESVGPDGTPIEFISASNEKEVFDQTSRALHRLVREHGLSEADIAVLTCRSVGNSAFANMTKIGAFLVSPLDTSAPARVVLESVRRFKGLERQVVILTGVEETTEEELLYVGLTRARSHLAVIGSPAGLSRVRGAGPDGVSQVRT